MSSIDRPALILLHAFPLDHRVWDDVIGCLRESPRWIERVVLTPDFRGFGATPLADSNDATIPAPSLDVLADDVLTGLDAAGIERAVVAGVSLGGYVAMALLRRAPERIVGLGLVDTKPGPDGVDARANRLRIADDMKAGGNVAALARAMLPGLLGPTTLTESPELVERVRDWIHGADPLAIAWVRRAMAQRPDSIRGLRDFTGPATIVWGEDDALAGWLEQDAMAQALQVPVRRIEAVGHLTPVEAPVEVAAAIHMLLDVAT